jgi:manganese oxidase
MIRIRLLVFLTLGCGRESALPVARANDHRTAAGKTENGVTTLRLVAHRASWHPGADTGRSLTAPAFAEEGRAPTIPGPLLRVRPHARVRIVVRNALSDTIVLCTPMRIACAERDTVRIAPGDSGFREFVAAGATTSLYRAHRVRGGKRVTDADANSLMGAIIVDSATVDRRERLLVINPWLDTADTNRFVQMINGRTWPHTERFEMAVGDTLRWRLLSAGSTEHPMHLHGFYCRVDARGDIEQDTTFTPEDRQLVVTENLRAFGTATITWAPARGGNWLFHCHKAAHMSANQLLALVGVSAPDTLPVHDAAPRAASGRAHVASRGQGWRRPEPVAPAPAAAGAPLRPGRDPRRRGLAAAR